MAQRPDEFFTTEIGQVGFSYRFVDKDGLPIPNEMGYRVMRYLKPSCVMHGRAAVSHDEVNHILVMYGRDELADILDANNDLWVPPDAKKVKVVRGEEVPAPVM